ncbi:hypothetical protein B296_00003755 [Ensete ventricosum]|uniref:Zinc finger Sec23/Sec24-type domain-containing protein n=1 Tax=Ensete ventricosum TaxID=4639 RepID=A0A427AE33_ENSVE|nr:hypothetical protein B296_00003755 [Ensete ventricosum]
MAVRASVACFPVNSEALETCGIPWGIAVTPFSAVDERGNPPARGSEGHLLPRCDSCWAYFNTYCELDQWTWSCAICGSLNGLTSHAVSRYSQPESCPELSSSFVDLEIPASEEFLELVKSSLLAALEGEGSGICHKIGLYDVQGPIPVVKNVFIPPESDGQLPVSLEDVMPLLAFLAPVWVFAFLSGPPDYGAGQLDTSRYDPPVIQIAFQYSIVVPNEMQNDAGLVSAARYSLKRRLRVKTLQFTTARSINDLYDSVDPEVVNLASLEKGVREGRLLIHDWLVILLSQYHDAYKLVRYENGSSTSNIDVAFTQCPQLQSLPRLVFALLRSPLLRFHEEGQERSITPKLMFIRGGHDDATAFENHLMEDKDVDGTGLPSVTGFFTFLEEVASDVSENIK